MTVEITLDKNKIKRGEDITVLIKRGNPSDNQLSLTIHDESDDSIYAIGISGEKHLDRIIIPGADMGNWDSGMYFVRIFGAKDSCSFKLID